MHVEFGREILKVAALNIKIDERIILKTQFSGNRL
jgi:hypothetical protein